MAKGLAAEPGYVEGVLGGSLIRTLLRYAGEDVTKSAAWTAKEWQDAKRRGLAFLRGFDIVGRTRDNERTARRVAVRAGLHERLPRRFLDHLAAHPAATHARNEAAEELHTAIIAAALEKNPIDKELYDSEFAD
mmetsp:Transcript_12940/g.27330  ORF Transcript_12940/g.27330 Transcript_12940/m.27330 type:complete len:134 (-) Transcript_12940:444-845(-)